MEFLVSMTTHVPMGTPEETIEDVKDREAAHSRQLAEQGHLLRLWRPPLQPGEWRSLGLFAAADDGQLEDVLASMPLRVWRSDEVTPLSPHPYDPAHTTKETTPEFLTRFAMSFRVGARGTAIDETETTREAARVKALAEQGNLERLWELPGDGRVLGLWRAADEQAMKAILRSLPLDSSTRTEITQLSPHPSDPLTTQAGRK
jgi:muconolactone delta-isomerase